ncbi:MAG: 50S ribosomal protein L10, partial [Minisyncoccia bacterium]
MKTRKQKTKDIELLNKLLDDNNLFVLINFQGLNTKFLNKVRSTLKNINAKMVVVKKKLFQIILNQRKLNFNVKNQEGQIGIIFGNNLVDIASVIYKFKTKNKNFKILNGYLITEDKVAEKDFIEM